MGLWRADARSRTAAETMGAVHDIPDTLPLGLVLAGGRSSRFGGGDKVFANLGNRPLLARVIERLAPQCRAVLLSVNGEAARFTIFGLPTIADHAEDHGKGPLAGLLAGLDWAAEQVPDTEAVVTIAGDTPALPRDLVQRLVAVRRQSGLRAAAARSGGRCHSLAAIWPVSGRDTVRRLLREEDRHRVQDCLERLGTAWVDWPDTPYDPFHNINRQADLLAAEAWIESA